MSFYCALVTKVIYRIAIRNDMASCTQKSTHWTDHHNDVVMGFSF